MNYTMSRENENVSKKYSINNRIINSGIIY